MNKKIFFLIVFTVNICHIDVFGQVVNIEKKRKENQNGFTGVISFGFDLIDNNRHITKFKNGIDIQYKRASHVWIFLNEIKLMKVNDDNLINDGFQHFRYNYTFNDSSFLTFEAFTQHQYNTIKLIQQRFLIGAGMRYRIINNNKITFYLATLSMYEYEKRSNENHEILEYARLTSYASISWNILNNLSFQHIGYYQPSFKDFKNYRIASESGLSIAISKMLFFKMALKLTIDSHPSKGVDNIFYMWVNSLQFKF